VYVDMFLNLPYPHWYREYCALNAPEEVAKYDELMEDIHAVIGAFLTSANLPIPILIFSHPILSDNKVLPVATLHYCCPWTQHSNRCSFHLLPG